MLHDVGKRSIVNIIKPQSAQRYSHRVPNSLNIEEEEAEGQKRKTGTGMIRVSGLSHNRSKQSDPRLAWFMLYRIYCMYSYIKNKEEINSDVVLTIMSEHEEPNKGNEELEDSSDNDEKNQPFLKNNHPL